MRRTLVLGAGLSGLSAAYHLQRAGIDAAVLEREDRVGGACRSFACGGYHFDLTGHLLHLGRSDSPELLRELGVWVHLRQHRRRAGIALGGTITPYPIQIHTYRLPAKVRRDCVLGFVRAREHGDPGEGGGFADWVLARFGEGFAEHFFFPYNRKLYCTEPAELTTEWVDRYVPRPSLQEVIDGAFGLHRAPVGYNACFYYPHTGGVQLLADALAARVGTIRLGTLVRAIHLGDREVELASGERLGWDELIATAPLSQLAAITVDLPPEARQAAARLRSVGVVNVNLGVEGRAPRREHWLYVPEVHVPFYRVGFPSNHGRLAPTGCHTVTVEVSVRSDTRADADLTERCLAGLEALGLLRSRAAIAAVEVLRIDPAYVVYDADRPAAVAQLRTCYRDAAVQLLGRWAEWKYSTMEDALWDGAATARRRM
jgi:protoporphyrinogen oxidase